MSELRKDCQYTKDHEWVKKTETTNVVRVGITDFAQASLGDVTFIELPSEGKEIKKGETIGSVESVKAVSDIYAPMSGKITKVNAALEEDPALINTKPFDDAWIIEMEVTNESEWSELLSPEAYEQHAQ